MQFPVLCAVLTVCIYLSAAENRANTNVSDAETGITATTRRTEFTQSRHTDRRTAKHFITQSSKLVTDESIPGELENCFCTYHPVDATLNAYVGTKELQFGDRVNKGHAAVLSCRYAHTYLKWRRGLRVHGNVNMFCDTCQTWQNSDLPYCDRHEQGDSYIVLSKEMKLLPGGTVEIQPYIRHTIICLNLDVQSPEWFAASCINCHMFYRKSYVGRKVFFENFLEVPKFKPGVEKTFTCRTIFLYGKFRPTELHIQVRDIICPELLPVNGMKIEYTNQRKVGSFATFHCFFPDVLVGRQTIQCLGDGIWDYTTFPTCKKQCSVQRIPNGSIKEQKIGQGAWDWRDMRYKKKVTFINVPYGTVFRRGMNLFLFCDSEYNFQGTGLISTSIHCSKGIWSPVPTCVLTQCSTDTLNLPGVDKNGQKFYRSGEQFKIVCILGFSLVKGQSGNIKCEDGIWKYSIPPCINEKYVQCPNIDSRGIYTINYSNERKLVKSVAFFYCKNIAQKIIGSNRRTCLQNGEWSDVNPTCVDIVCPEFETTNGLQVSYTDGNRWLSSAKFLCEFPTSLHGENYSLCLHDGTWSKPKPVCQGKSGCLPFTKPSESKIILKPRKDSYSFGESLTFSCPPGLYLNQKLQRIRCLRSGWSEKILPECVDSKLFD